MISCKTFFARTAVAVLPFLSSPALAQGVAPTLDDPQYAQNVAGYLTQNCPVTVNEANNTDNATKCIDATLRASYSIAVELSDYLKDNVASTSPFQAGLAQGDLLAHCETPAKAAAGKIYGNLKAYLDAASSAAGECLESIRRAGDAVGIDYQPTARNTVANHINCLKRLPACARTSSPAPVPPQ